MKLLNGHDLKKGDTVKVMCRGDGERKLITHICSRFIHVGDKLFFKSSGNGANAVATGYKLQKV